MNPPAPSPAMRCRHCGSALPLLLADLGTAPPSNAYLDPADLNRPERWYPLRVRVCETCWLAQTEDFTEADQLFDARYAYFSSTSTSWLAHARDYVDAMCQRFALGPQSQVVEVAANDGYLLQYVAARGIPCIGVEPTASTAAAARARGLTIVERFFGTALARELLAQGHAADLMAANNVLAHVPDINDFVSGFALLLKPGGVATFEFPHLLELVQQGQFDTLYHEHFSYLSLSAVQRIFAANGLRVADVQTLPTHGGSLRVFARRSDAAAQAAEADGAARVQALLEREREAGIQQADFYRQFLSRPAQIKAALLSFLLWAQSQGHRVGAYGAAAKGNTLLNYAGIRPDLLPYVVDRSPGKQGRFLPGSRIPIVDEAHLRADRPRYILILPWNLRDEVMAQLADARDWGAEFVVAIPRLQIL